MPRHHTDRLPLTRSTPLIDYLVIAAPHAFLSHNIGGEEPPKALAANILPPAVTLHQPDRSARKDRPRRRYRAPSGFGQAASCQACIYPGNEQPTNLPEALRQALLPE